MRSYLLHKIAHCRLLQSMCFEIIYHKSVSHRYTHVGNAIFSQLESVAVLAHQNQGKIMGYCDWSLYVVRLSSILYFF